MRILANWQFRIGALVLLAIILLAALSPWIAPFDPQQQDIAIRLMPPDGIHWLGTDEYGRDTLSRLLCGAPWSLLIGFCAIAVAAITGTAIGLIAGYRGGWLDTILSQAMDMLLAFPALIVGLILVAMLGATLVNIVIAIAVTAIPAFARVARAPAMALREREFVLAGRALGFSEARILLRHILPNIAPDILVMASLWMAAAVRTEASLAFVGLGLPPPIPTWGGIVREGFDNILDSHALALFPSLAVLLLVVALSLIGDGLRDAIDPRLKGDA